MIALGGEEDVYPYTLKPALIIPQGPLVSVWLLVLGLPSGKVRPESNSPDHVLTPLRWSLRYSHRLLFRRYECLLYMLDYFETFSGAVWWVEAPTIVAVLILLPQLLCHD
jgi:hypothetical protein